MKAELTVRKCREDFYAWVLLIHTEAGEVRVIGDYQYLTEETAKSNGEYYAIHMGCKLHEGPRDTEKNTGSTEGTGDSAANIS